MAVLTINQYIDTINSFVNNVKSTKNSYYIFYGKTNSWVNSNGLSDDTAIPTANSSVYSYEQSIYKDLVFGKLINESDITYMIPRYDWTSGTVYEPYNQEDSNLYDKQFYVITDAYEVYKCIDNNNGAASTVKPSLTVTSGVFTTSDAYVWKYMFTIEANANTKFTSSTYVPVTPNNSVITNSVNGSIDFIKMKTSGNNYQAYHTGYLQNFKDNYNVVIANNASAIAGRYNNSSIYLKTGFGSGQIRKISNYNGLNRLVTVNEPFETSSVLNISDVNGSFIIGTLASQRIDYISFLYPKGYYNIDDQLIQSDTAITANVISANSTQIRVVKSSSNDFVQNLPIYNTLQGSTQKSGTVDIVTGILRTLTITNHGSGYTGNAVVTLTNNFEDYTGTDGAANSTANSTGRISAINITNVGTNYSKAPDIFIAPPAPITFNANTAIDEDNDFINISGYAQYFSDGDYIQYTVASGNTPLTNLINGNRYYVLDANSSGFKLATDSITSTPISLTKGKTETGHNIKGETAAADASILTYFITSNSGTSFTGDFSVNDYVRVGANNDMNIRRVTAVNSSVIVVNTPLTVNAIANSIHKVPYAVTPTSITSLEANGFISNTNLNSITLTYGNSSIGSLLYTVGERVDMVGSDNVAQGANGIISYCNSSAVILSDVEGVFATGVNNFIRGASSLQKSNIISTVSFPNITLSSPRNNFIAGQKIFIKTVPDLSVVGNASLVASYKIPNELTEYIISPAVNIDGDGSDAIAYSVVNTASYSANEINSVVVLNPGKNYTYANITFSSNNLFGSGATANPVVAPLSGHGHNAYKELGARYAGISVTIDTGENEGFKFPTYGKYRKIGILENPLFVEASAHISDYDRINLSLRNKSGSGFTNGEFIVQSYSNAAGVIVVANSTYMQLKNIKGVFVQNSSGDDIYGLSSETTANVYVANTITFVASNVSLVSETVSNAYGTIVEANNSVIKLNNVSGRFDVNDIVYDPLINAYANVTAIYTVNNTVDSSYSFGSKFSQLARITLSSNTGNYLVGEKVSQTVSGASGEVISSETDKDIAITNANGSFNIGNQITDEESGATAMVTFANTSYLRVTSVDGVFTNSDRIINNLNVGADISSVYSVLVLNNVNGENKFQTSSNVIIGSQSGAVGKSEIATTILYPELVRDSGSVIYLENVEPITRSTTSKEKINLIIKF